MSELGSDGTVTPAREPSPPRPSRSRLAALVAIAVLGGLIGGLLVMVVGWRGRDRPGGDTQAVCVATTVAEQVLPSVVTILTTNGGSGSNGTGVIIRPDGYILTNDHVITSAADGGEVSVRYSDGVAFPATIVGRDPLTDLAVVKASDGAEGRPVIDVGSSASLRVGQPVVALGAPLGLHSTVTSGVVSALDRYVPVPVREGVTAHLVDAVQTDAAINPGNSGGALVDCSGELVGINSAIATVPNATGHGGGGSVGLGFAIPVDLAAPLAQELIASGRVQHPSFGLQAQTIPPTAAEQAGAPVGLFVTAVDAGGPAERAGIRPGDIITAVDATPATSVAALEVAALTREAGDAVEVTYSRDGTSTTTDVTLSVGA